MSYRRQYAVLWANNGYDSYGQPDVSSPIELRVRWEATLKQITKPDGSPLNIDATVIVDREIAVGSYMWLGRLNQLEGTAGIAEINVMEVISCIPVPDLKNRVTHRKVLLMRSGNRDLPNS